jgi:hypothetical protein
MIVKKWVSGREGTRWHTRLCCSDGIVGSTDIQQSRDSGNHKGVWGHVSPGKTCWSTWVREGGLKKGGVFLHAFLYFAHPLIPTLTPLSLVSSLSLSLSLSLSHLKSTKFSCSLSLLGLYLLGSSAPSLSLSSISNNFSWKHESELYMNVITLFFKLFFI